MSSFVAGQEKASSSGQEALDSLAPLSSRGVIAGDFTGPGTRHVLWGPDQEDHSLPWVRRPNLLVEFERFRRGVSANVEHDEIVDWGCHRNRAVESSSASCTSTA